MATIEEILVQAERLSPAEQAQLVARLAEHLGQTLAAPEQAMMRPDVSPEAEEEPPAFWIMPDSDAEWEQLQAKWAERQRNPPTPEEARAETRAMLDRWFSKPLTEAEAIELAMSEDIAEWNLDV